MSYRKSKCLALTKDLHELVSNNQTIFRVSAGISFSPGFASFFVARFALEGIINWSRNPRRGSAASRDAAYSCDAASAGKTGLDTLVPVMLVMNAMRCLEYGIASQTGFEL